MWETLSSFPACRNESIMRRLGCKRRSWNATASCAKRLRALEGGVLSFPTLFTSNQPRGPVLCALPWRKRTACSDGLANELQAFLFESSLGERHCASCAPWFLSFGWGAEDNNRPSSGGAPVVKKPKTMNMVSKSQKDENKRSSLEGSDACLLCLCVSLDPFTREPFVFSRPFHAVLPALFLTVTLDCRLLGGDSLQRRVGRGQGGRSHRWL